MKNRRYLVCFLSIYAACSLITAAAQSPGPIIVQAATPAAPTPATALPPPSSADSTSIQVAIKALEEMKTQNEDTLSKQEATLQQLDELQKAAQQIKIFAHRSSG
jgi:hypothetical protein